LVELDVTIFAVSLPSPLGDDGAVPSQIVVL